MKQTSFICSIIMLMVLAGCAHNTPDFNSNAPITLPIETIKSNGTLIHQPFSKDRIALLEQELKKIVMITGTKGISASVGVPDKGIWYSALGVTGNAPKEQITSDLKICAGSIGKIFTAVVILKLIEEDRLGLEDSVEEWFPEISWAGSVTVNHLLTHTSGIASFDDVKDYESHKYLYRNPGELLSYVTKKGLLFEPGEHFDYSNTGYLMLGIIIEKVTGRSYGEAVAHYITNEINLQNTAVITSGKIEKLKVNGHHNGIVLSKPDDYVLPFAASSIAATPSDLIIFLQALMSGKLLSQDSLQLMFSDMNLMTTTQRTYYGKGVVVALKTPVGDVIGHTGGMKGFGASLFYHPEQNLFVCVMMNDDIKAVDPAMFRLMKAMMDL